MSFLPPNPLMAIAAFLFAVVLPIATYLMKAFGIGFVTFVGVKTLIDTLENYLQQHLNSLPPEMIAMISMLKIDVAISILISAVTARLVLDGFKGGRKKKFILEA